MSFTMSTLSPDEGIASDYIDISRLVQCSSCGFFLLTITWINVSRAILSCISNVSDGIWKCEFCSEHNKIPSGVDIKFVFFPKLIINTPGNSHLTWNFAILKKIKRKTQLKLQVAQKSTSLIHLT